MRCKLKTFNVGIGDCVTLLLENNGEEVHVLVDCGCYKKEVDEYITNEFGGRIDYLIVTHIDNDHICGLITMLESKPDLVILHILYNCYQRTSDVLHEWDEKMIQNVQRVYGHLPVVVDMLQGQVNAEASKTLAELILANENRKKAWQREYVTADSKAIELGGNMGRFIFLSPSKQALESLDVEYRRLFWQLLYKKKVLDYNQEETIYEALLRIMGSEHEGNREEMVSAKVLNEQALKDYANEPLGTLTKENMASIAFVWEYKEHRILFMGDASPEQVCEKLKEVYQSVAKPVLFDAIKVSHHGSAHSMSNELMALADSERWFVTGGASTRPSYQALARILTHALPEGIIHRDIRYNRENGVLKTFASSDMLKEKYHYSIIADANEYEVSY